MKKTAAQKKNNKEPYSSLNMSSIDDELSGAKKKGNSKVKKEKNKQGFSEVSKSIVEYGFATTKTKSSRERGNDSTDYQHNNSGLKDASRVYLINEPSGENDQSK